MHPPAVDLLVNRLEERVLEGDKSRDDQLWGAVKRRPIFTVADDLSG